MMDIFALLDDADASPSQPTSRLYTGFVREHRCTDPATLDALCAAAQADLAAGLHAVLLADYEWGAKLLRVGHAKLAADDTSCLRLLMFDTLQHLDADAVAQWLAQQEGTSTPAPRRYPRTATRDHPASVRGRDRAHPRSHPRRRDLSGHTYRMLGQAWGSPLALYRRLRTRQRVNFGALMRLPLEPGDGTEWVLSRSPELFVRHQQGLLQPTKFAPFFGACNQRSIDVSKKPSNIVDNVATSNLQQ